MHRNLFALGTFILFFLPVTVFGQVTDAQKKYTAFDMRSNGKIYVVVTVVLIILLGLFLYLIRLDRKITRLEKENRK
jgi:CcmD family protein